MAIELTAPWTRVLSVAEIAERLEHAVPLMISPARDVDPRHRTMEATVAWSTRLLDADDRGLFLRLAVFAGGFDLDAADAVAQPGPGILLALTRLVDSSLVQAGPAADGAMRYVVVSLNLVRSRLRRARRYEQLLRLVPRPDSPAACDNADALAVRAALARLPRRQREAVVLFYWLDLSVTDAARAMGASAGMVKNALFRARITMATWLSEPEEGEPDGA